MKKHEIRRGRPRKQREVSLSREDADTILHEFAEANEVGEILGRMGDVLEKFLGMGYTLGDAYQIVKATGLPMTDAEVRDMFLEIIQRG